MTSVVTACSDLEVAICACDRFVWMPDVRPGEHAQKLCCGGIL